MKTRPHRTPSFFTVFGVWHACLRANTLHLKHTYLMPIHVCIFNVCAYLCLYVLCIWNMVTVLCRHPIIKKCVPCECHFHFLWPYLHRMYCLVCPLSGCYPAKSAVFTLTFIWGHPVGRRANCNCQLQCATLCELCVGSTLLKDAISPISAAYASHRLDTLTLPITSTRLPPRCAWGSVGVACESSCTQTTSTDLRRPIARYR